MTYINYIALYLGYLILGCGAIFGAGFTLWFCFLGTAGWFIKKYQDWDIFCDAVVMVHKKRGIDAYRTNTHDQ